MERDAQITIVIGRNGTGKSTLCEDIVNKINARTIAITYSGAPKIWRKYKELDISSRKDVKNHKKGIRQVRAASYETGRKGTDLFKHIYTNFYNGSVLFDDCRAYIPSDIDRDDYFRKLLLDFRHRMLDLYFVVHSPSDVPPRVWGFTTTVWMGSTASILKPSQARIDSESVMRIATVQAHINELYRVARERNDKSHYGIFKRIQV